MAQPRKVVAANAQPQAPARSPAQRPASATTRPSGLRTALTIFALFVIVGALPIALGGEAFGYWRLPITSAQLGASPWALSYDTALTSPMPVLTKATVHVVTAPGGSSAVATLDPGSAAQVTRYASRAGVRWAQIRWGGPTHAAGGTGWAQASQLDAAKGASQSGAHDSGDLGALSPVFGRAIDALGPGFSSALSFPAAGASYHTAAIDQSETLGTQVIPLLLVALYAKGVVAAQPNASSGPPQIARDLASGNAQALTFDYELVGDAPGMDTFLTQHSVSGFQFAARQPLQTKGTAHSLALFYAALANGSLVNAHDQAEILTLLASVNSAAATAITPQTVIGSGALQVTTANGNGGVVTIAAGILTPAGGTSVAVVAIAHGATSADATKALQTWAGRLIPIIQG
ncbi:MAG TPA: hypothetical protein VFN78_06080 [Ktedonobacterales bacterium]|nr:hypothetical protein [Ktedonobacterales bacterium]